jgi:N-carbamoyl-L-amino-acid hydrolase
METRRDALLTAAGIVAAVNRVALEHAPHGRGTVGCLEVSPASRNVIPGTVRLTVDLRAAGDAVLSEMDRAFRGYCASAGQGKCGVQVEQVMYFPPQPFDPALRASIAESARALGLSAMDAISGAGHDAVYMARVAPAAMIFVPCKDGISHNEIEDARPEHLEAGCNVLLRSLLSTAKRA